MKQKSESNSFGATSINRLVVVDERTERPVILAKSECSLMDLTH